ncbi:MAG: TRAP transporter small permease [Gammaproteobacteria bacterium]|jgi:C4-dicarboxylate transporter, DctQ subunit|nr:TRAP transporter small permease [Gammaproteobacteria bacterium]
MSKTRQGGGRTGAPFLFYLESTTRWLSTLSLAVGALVSVMLAFIVGYSVLMRYLFNHPQTWTDELSGYLLVLIVMMGLAEALRRGDHIGVDLLTSRLSEKGRRLIEIWGMLAVIAFSTILLTSSWQMVAFSYSVGLISDGYVEAPMWIPQSTQLIGFSLLILAAVNRLIQLLTGFDPDRHPELFSSTHTSE